MIESHWYPKNPDLYPKARRQPNNLEASKLRNLSLFLLCIGRSRHFCKGVKAYQDYFCLFGPEGWGAAFKNVQKWCLWLQFSDQSGVATPCYPPPKSQNNMNFYILHFCHTCSLCRLELVVQFPVRDSTQVLLCLFPGVFWLWHFLYSVDPHPVWSLHIFTFIVSRAFIEGAASQRDADSSRAPGLTFGLEGSVNVHRGALLLVPQWQCISSYVFYIIFIVPVKDL